MNAIPPPIHPSSSAAPGPVPNHLIWAIVSTVLGFCLCCPALITGIVAIVFSSKVNGLLNMGDIDGARRASNTAKTWCIVTSVLAVIGLLINIGMVATGGMQGYMDYMQQLQHMQ
ncbi:CD225/dispanin family protein [Xanthomonas cassavae CFBP 4642]|uniref:CD225/dispanin family protein n=1 Tax=Xanthomonas cassavae CFBP 4642 TaxID=1219375 RepID=A0ABS8HJZ3_9XANT|nr:CD225/dispanin family protein [Xanthomonas cassavae]MCC4621942.1 CD225/dispanin family protein [Xanthomonas cassavae CFBP 4642]